MVKCLFVKPYLYKCFFFNLQTMEDKWEERRDTKRYVDIFDREQLRYNPINWSCTLK